MAHNEQRGLVKNAADPKQVKDAAKREESKRQQELNDICAILALTEGRRFLWRILGHCKAFESVWSPNAQIHYNAGIQDVGHFLMAEITEANAEAMLLMMKEAIDTDR